MEKVRLLLPGNRLFVDLYFCGGGRSSCFPGHGFGPDVRLNYLIHYVISGKGLFETDSRRYFLSKGQCFLIEPGVSTFYQVDSQEPWSYLWLRNVSVSAFPASGLSLSAGRQAPGWARELLAGTFEGTFSGQRYWKDDGNLYVSFLSIFIKYLF